MSDTQSEIRHDPVRGHTTIIAPTRGRRPNAVRTQEPQSEGDTATDPFLLGNEHLTTEELFAIRDANDDWSVRVVKNRYPALQPNSGPADPTSRVASGTGQHEVIIECPDFETELANLPPDQIARVLRAWQSRLTSIREDGRFDYALIFKNSGRSAGASLPHAHSQLIATPESFIPIRIELERSRQFHLQNGMSLLESTIDLDRKAGLVVCEESGFVAWCPFASRFSSEVWLAGPQQPFQSLSEDNVSALAEILHSLLNAIRTIHANAAYNIMLHATPFSSCEEAWFQWRMEICPRLASLAGFELATGCYINAIPPEDAAQQIRQVLTATA